MVRFKKTRKKSTAKKNLWVVKQAYQMYGGWYVIEFVNRNKKARFTHRKVRIFTREKKIDIYYEGPNGAYLEKHPKYTAGWRKMILAQRGKFYKTR